MALARTALQEQAVTNGVAEVENVRPHGGVNPLWLDLKNHFFQIQFATLVAQLYRLIGCVAPHAVVDLIYQAVRNRRLLARGCAHCKIGFPVA